ncbi:hypothetical protein FQN54_004274 [Arachnomyces sp. PD_36]|nr:hypothetical protein FQN54_004274 [Arachnomyces sp. PD_36]
MSSININPLSAGYGQYPHASKKTFLVSGMLVTVFGLEELSSQVTEVSCLWLLHPRLNTQEGMEPIASVAIADWNTRRKEGRVDAAQRNKGLIAVSLDQRNHGTRELDKLANDAWRSGNPRHVQDMFSIYNGTARDVSLLLDFLPCYIFPEAERTITQNIVLGISLGGHAAWHCILHEPRIRSAVIIISCPDYINLMSDRARLSKLKSWTESSPPGINFVGSRDFPNSLVESVKRWDPAALLLSQLESGPINDGPLRAEHLPEPTEEEKEKIRPILKRCLAGKRILNLSGGADKLVPYRSGKPFFSWFGKAIGPGGWYKDGAISFEDIIFDGVGHEASPKMIEQAVRFISETLASGDDRGGAKVSRVRESRM